VNAVAGAPARGGRAGELAWLAAIVAAGAAVRLVGCASPRTPRWYFALTAVTSAHEALAGGGLLHRWVALLGRTDASWPHESAIVMPVHTLLQALVGPSFGLPQLGGTLWALGAIVLAWALGRRLHSPCFGLVFATLVAASPLQIAWARLGGIQIPAVTHVLLVAWLGYVAGRSGSVPALLGTAVALVATLYHYYAARIAIPLAPLAVLAGVMARPPRDVARWRTAALACLLVALGVAAVGSGQQLWPRYPGYLGSTGLGDPAAMARDARANVIREAPAVARTYFWRGRAYGIVGGAPIGSNAPPWSADIAAGGLCLVPVALLGMAGLGVAVRRWRRDFFWLALVVTGALAPLLSVTTARRLLLLDLGWCAAAALATTALVGATPPRRRRGAAALALAAALGLAGYAGAVVVRLGERLPPMHGAIIPFAESGFGDGIACPGCVARAYRWQDEIARGAFVVLLDSDETRENRTSPGGLRLDGRIAAMAAGRPAAFVDWYGLARNWDPDPPRFGPLYDETRTDAVAELVRRLRAVRPARMVWHFAQPTAWERALADRLVAAGGGRRPTHAAPLGGGERRSTDPGFEVVTPGRQRAQAVRALAAFVQPPAVPVAVRVAVEAVRPLDAPATVIASGRAAAPPADGIPPYATWHAVAIGDRRIGLGGSVALVSREAALHAIDREGRTFLLDAAGGMHPAGGMPRSIGIGPACAALAGGRWWIVDPVAGSIEATDRTARREGGVVGLASLDDGARLVVATADQTLRIEDPASGAADAVFPAYVPPSRQWALGECTPVLATDDWLATFDDLADTLAVYARDGRPLGVLHLDQALHVPRHTILTLATSRRRLLVGTAAPRLHVARLDVPRTAPARRTTDASPR
jgi:hypothetical protein